MKLKDAHYRFKIILFLLFTILILHQQTIGKEPMETKQKTRSEISDEFKWKLEDIFSSDQDWENEFTRVKKAAPELEVYKGKLNTSGKTLVEFISKMHTLEVSIGKLYAYAHMKNDQDKSVAKYQELYDRIRGLYVEYSETVSFFEPELLAIPEKKLNEFFKNEKGLTLYKHYIEDMTRTRAHTLSEKEERLMALSGEVRGAAGEIFSVWNNADIVFPVIKDENSNDIQLTNGLYGKYQQSSDRRLREASYKGLYVPYTQHRNMLAASYSSTVKSHIFNARARNYKSTVEAALDRNAVPVEVYHTLIKTLNENLGPLHRYVALRKKILKLEDGVHDYDLRAPLFESATSEYTWDQAINLVVDGLQPMGSNYIASLEKGFNEGWVDVYENKGKRSGAYSSGTYGVHPYVLMNYNGTLYDVFTLAHEMGHALHTYYTINNQPYVYGDYPIFLAEVASTANEALLQQYLIDNAPTKEEKLALLNSYLDKFSRTFFRQAVFAEFELRSHEMVENGEALTADKLDDLFGEIYQKYYGPDFVMDQENKALWSRIPHFYYNYYVFQYSTSFVASSALVSKIMEEGDTARDRFINFLSSGRSEYPMETLKKAGVDMSTADPVVRTIKLMDALLDQVESLLNE